jgi:RAV-like factor
LLVEPGTEANSGGVGRAATGGVGGKLLSSRCKGVVL